MVLGLIVPHPGEQATLFCVRLQVTPLFVESLVTVAVNCCVAPASTLTATPMSVTGPAGLTETVIGGVAEGTVMVAAMDLLASATEVAVRATFRSLAGAGVGAV